MTVYLKRRSARELLYSYEYRFLPASVDMEDSYMYHFLLKGGGGGKFTVEILEKRLYICDGIISRSGTIIKCADKTFEDIELGRLKLKTAIERGLISISDMSSYSVLMEAIEIIS